MSYPTSIDWIQVSYVLLSGCIGERGAHLYFDAYLWAQFNFCSFTNEGDGDYLKDYSWMTKVQILHFRSISILFPLSAGTLKINWCKKMKGIVEWNFPSLLKCITNAATTQWHANVLYVWIVVKNLYLKNVLLDSVSYEKGKIEKWRQMCFCDTSRNKTCSSFVSKSVNVRQPLFCFSSVNYGLWIMQPVSYLVIESSEILLSEVINISDQP